MHIFTIQKIIIYETFNHSLLTSFSFDFSIFQKPSPTKTQKTPLGPQWPTEITPPVHARTEEGTLPVRPQNKSTSKSDIHLSINPASEATVIRLLKLSRKGYPFLKL